MLEVVGLAAGYLGERVIDGIDIEVRTGEAVAIVGSNGAGKTTLFRTIAGLLPAMEGRVLFDGKDLTRRPAHRISRDGIAYVPAERHLFPAMTLKSNLVLGAYPEAARSRDASARVRPLPPLEGTSATARGHPQRR